MVRNRAFRVAAAALAAAIVAFIATAALGFLVLTGLMFVLMPHSEWSGYVVGALLLLVFGLTFVVCFRETLDKLTPE